ncbi:LacI family transcriptional regulator [Rhodococcus sp. HNM0563]|uniref:substrate-binding domain-containing protein n=1 Tax=Rhodococcus sp. HNM0563 TaxID=2716339 RepID=UPI00146B7E56|nr:LacI family transcriptional regulator [Rhodococcus sp. HNM0563]
MRRTTIRDVADAAGVSTATVSYVLNDTPNQTITAATQDRVRAAADALGYPPRTVTSPSEVVASPVVLLNVGTDVIGTSIGRLIRTMQEELRRHDRTLVVISEGRDAAQDLRRKLGPLAVVDLSQLPDDLRDDHIWGAFRGHQAGFPFHTRLQLQHLAEHGHRHVALAIPAEGTGSFGRARIADAHRAALDLGLAPLTVVRVSMDPDPRARTESVRTLVQESDVTAVASLNDAVALSVLSVMTQLGYRAPEDLAVIGFDDEHQESLWEPELTTVRIDTAAYGRRAARLAVDATTRDWTEAPSTIVRRASA